MASKASSRGTQMPSLRPLSTLRSSRIAAGTRGLETTGCPRAASVGASTTERTATSTNWRSGNRTAPTTPPSRIVNGRPSVSSRTGRRVFRRSTDRLALAASVNRIRDRVSSAITFKFSDVGLMLSQPRTDGPSSTPRMRNTKAPEIGELLSRAETRLYR